MLNLKEFLEVLIHPQVKFILSLTLLMNIERMTNKIKFLMIKLNKKIINLTTKIFSKICRDSSYFDAIKI